jgi:hypothetical protein
VSSRRLGRALQRPAPGTRVVLLNVWGSWRELIVSPAERVIPVPGDLSDEDAAQALVNPVTAWVMTMVEHDLKPGHEHIEIDGFASAFAVADSPAINAPTLSLNVRLMVHHPNASSCPKKLSGRHEHPIVSAAQV